MLQGDIYHVQGERKNLGTDLSMEESIILNAQRRASLEKGYI